MSELMATYFIQYPVERVTGSDGDWTIEFEGGGKIHCTDGDKPDVKGRGLVNVLYDAERTTLVFTGDRRVLMPPTEYTVSHPRHTQGEEVYPQRPVEEEPPPPDPSAERVADGPSAPEGDDDDQA